MTAARLIIHFAGRERHGQLYIATTIRRLRIRLNTPRYGLDDVVAWSPGLRRESTRYFTISRWPGMEELGGGRAATIAIVNSTELFVTVANNYITRPLAIGYADRASLTAGGLPITNASFRQGRSPHDGGLMTDCARVDAKGFITSPAARSRDAMSADDDDSSAILPRPMATSRTRRLRLSGADY
jgi:hypothetical protein